MNSRDLARFMAKVYIEPMGPFRSPHAEGPCWLWTASRDRNGYGAFGLRGRKIGAHRAALLLFGVTPMRYMGPLRERPRRERLVTMHRCDNPSCVNPEHLRMGTYVENTKDMHRKERDGARRRGWRVRLSPEQVLDAVRLAEEGWKAGTLARRFCVDYDCMIAALSNNRDRTSYIRQWSISARTARYGSSASEHWARSFMWLLWWVYEHGERS